MRRSSPKRTKPLKRHALRRKVVAKTNAITKRLAEDVHARWLRLVYYLVYNRSHGVCEVCGKRPDWRGLSGHHIIFRSHGRIDTAGNTLTSCGVCHDHTKYPKSGLPISVEEAQELVKKLNEKAGIADDFIPA